MAPILTLITVTRNDLDGLRRTLQSAALQRGELLEHIVVDGASTDGTVEFLASIDDGAVTRYVSRPDRGIYHAMNRGLSMATGEWVLFLNSGDTLHADFSLEHFAGFALSRRSTIVGLVELHWQGDLYLNPNVERLDAQIVLPPHQGFFAPRVHYQDMRFDERFPVTADRRWMTAAQRRFDVVLYPYPVACFQLGGISNRPCWRSIKLRAREGPKPLMNEAVKWCMYKTLGTRLYYRVLYARKYRRLSAPLRLKP